MSEKEEFESLEWLNDMSVSKAKKLAILDTDILKHEIEIERLKLEIDKLKLWKTRVRELHRKRKP